MKVGIIGAGAYGLALAIAFKENNCDITMWTKSPEEVEELKTQVNTIVQNISSNDFEQLANQLNTITRRLDRMEEQMQDKANDVVTYQLLQHRREMEEMLERIQKLEAALTKEEPIYITPDSKPTYEREKKPKRRKMIFSIFGL